MVRPVANLAIGHQARPVEVDALPVSGSAGHTAGGGKQPRRSLAGAIPVAIASFTIAALHVGVVGAAVTFGVTLTALFGLLWFALRHDRSRRATHLPPGVIATAGSNVRAAQLGRFEATIQLLGGSGMLLGGDAEVTPAAFAWRPRRRFRRRGATDVFIPVDDIVEAACTRLRGIVRCDACCFTLRDGRELIVNITDPMGIEQALRGVGVRVTGNA